MNSCPTSVWDQCYLCPKPLSQNGEVSCTCLQPHPGPRKSKTRGCRPSQGKVLRFRQLLAVQTFRCRWLVLEGISSPHHVMFFAYSPLHSYISALKRNATGHSHFKHVLNLLGTANGETISSLTTLAIANPTLPKMVGTIIHLADLRVCGCYLLTTPCPSNLNGKIPSDAACSNRDSHLRPGDTIPTAVIQILKTSYFKAFKTWISLSSFFGSSQASAVLSDHKGSGKASKKIIYPQVPF